MSEWVSERKRGRERESRRERELEEGPRVGAILEEVNAEGEEELNLEGELC